jgi:hypothetical protein
MSNTAAPLLGGFSIALIGVVAQATDHFRWPGVALLLLACASIAFIICVQTAFWARQYLVRPDEVKGWYEFQRISPEKIEELRVAQAEFAEGYVPWTTRSKTFYSLANLFLIAGVAVVLMPTIDGDGSEQAVWRWVATGAATAMFVFEIYWIVGWRLIDSKNRVIRKLAQLWFQPVKPSTDQIESS